MHWSNRENTFPPNSRATGQHTASVAPTGMLRSTQHATRGPSQQIFHHPQAASLQSSPSGHVGLPRPTPPIQSLQPRPHPTSDEKFASAKTKEAKKQLVTMLMRGNLKGIETLIAQIDRIDDVHLADGQNVLHMLAKIPCNADVNYKRIVDSLISMGANLTEEDANKHTPLDYACNVVGSNHDIFLALFDPKRDEARQYVMNKGSRLLQKVAWKGDVNKLRWFLEHYHNKEGKGRLLHLPLDIYLFNEIIKMDIDINALNQYSQTVLHAKINNLDKSPSYQHAMSLVKHLAINVNSSDGKQTILHSLATQLITTANTIPNGPPNDNTKIIIEHKLKPLVKLFAAMLNKGAKLNATDANQQSVIYEIASHVKSAKSLEILERAIQFQKGHLKIFDGKYNKKAIWCTNPLDMLILYHMTDEAIMLIHNQPEYLYNRGTNGETCLHIAAMSHHPDNNKIADEIVKRMPELVNTLDKYGMAPLHKAAKFGNEHITKLLLTNRSHVEIIASNQMSPLDYAVRYNNYGIAEILIAKGANINRQDTTFHATAFMRAVISGDLSAVKFLHDKNANISLKNIDGDTVFDLAVKYTHYEILDYLLSKYKNDVITNQNIFNHLKNVVRDADNIEELSKIFKKHDLASLSDGIGAEAATDVSGSKQSQVINIDMLKSVAHESDDKIKQHEKNIVEADELIKKHLERDLGERELDKDKIDELAADFCKNVKSAISNRDKEYLRRNNEIQVKERSEDERSVSTRLAEEKEEIDTQVLSVQKRVFSKLLGEEGLQREINSINADSSAPLSTFYQEIKKTIQTIFYAMAAIEGGVQESPTKGEQKRKVGISVVKMAVGIIPGGDVINKIIGAAHSAYENHKAGKRSDARQNALDIVLFGHNGIEEVATAAARAMVKTLEPQILALRAMPNPEECAKSMASFFVMPMLSHLSSGAIKSTDPEMVGNEMAQAALMNPSLYPNSYLDKKIANMKGIVHLTKDHLDDLLHTNTRKYTQQARDKMYSLLGASEQRKLSRTTDKSVEFLKNMAESYLRSRYEDPKVQAVFDLLDLAKGCHTMQQLDMMNFIDNLGVHIRDSEKEQSDVFFVPTTSTTQPDRSIIEPINGYREAIDGLETVGSLKAKRSLKFVAGTPTKPYLHAANATIERCNTSTEAAEIEKALEQQVMLQHMIDDRQSEQIRDLTTQTEKQAKENKELDRRCTELAQENTALRLRCAHDETTPGKYRLLSQDSWRKVLLAAQYSPEWVNDFINLQSKPETQGMAC